MAIDLIKVGGAELRDGLPHVAQYLSQPHQTTQRIIVFGGGPQIDTAWEQKHPGQTTTKVEGTRVTDEDMMIDAVMPAFLNIRHQLRAEVQGINLIHPDDVKCIPHPNEQLGRIGEVRYVKLPSDFNTVGIGFVGTDEKDILRLYNLKGDSIVSSLVAQLNRSVGNVVLVTGPGGVRDNQHFLVPHLTRSDIRLILEGKHPTIPVSGGMVQKLQETELMLEMVPRVWMVKAQQLLQPLENLGTLCTAA